MFNCTQDIRTEISLYCGYQDNRNKDVRIFDTHMHNDSIFISDETIMTFREITELIIDMNPNNHSLDVTMKDNFFSILVNNGINKTLFMNLFNTIKKSSIVSKWFLYINDEFYIEIGDDINNLHKVVEVNDFVMNIYEDKITDSFSLMKFTCKKNLGSYIDGSIVNDKTVYSEKDINYFKSYIADLSYGYNMVNIFNGEKLDFRDIKDYTSLFQTDNDIIYIGDNNIKIAFIKTDQNPMRISFANCMETISGGVHLKFAERKFDELVVNSLGIDKSHCDSIRNNITIIVKYICMDPDYCGSTLHKLRKPVPFDFVLSDESKEIIKTWCLNMYVPSI